MITYSVNVYTNGLWKVFNTLMGNSTPRFLKDNKMHIEDFSDSYLLTTIKSTQDLIDHLIGERNRTLLNGLQLLVDDMIIEAKHRGIWENEEEEI